MPPKRSTAAAVGKTLEERRDAARDAALKELKALRADLTTLEAVLSGRRKASDISLFDVTHGALEIFRYAAAVFEADSLLAACSQELDAAKALEYLDRHGATELVKPAGWHWISPKGEMHCLGKAEEPVKAASKLAEILQGGRRSRRRDKAEANNPESAAPEDVADTAQGADGDTGETTDL
ncbi:MAG: hypothetical protein AB7U59_03930 [Desulfovibrionaceae bacterium]